MPTLTELADQLAVAVGAQWEAEAAMRRLNDPWPLPVSWDTADPCLTDAWELLVRLAGSGAGWPEPPPLGTWAAGPEGLAGSGGELVEVLARVPTGRLVVLGEPGSGKTMLMVRLVLDLLARRSRGGPVPVLVSAASWNPAGEDLRSWLAAQLVTGYPALAAAPPPGSGERTLAAALLAAGLITPLLDGLDEIPDAVRGPAVSKINDTLQPGKPFVVTCRSQQYEEAVRPKDGSEVTLRGAGAVQLLPLRAEDVRGYLCDDAAGPVARARWNPVLKVLGTEAPAGQALRTPLMVGLARAIYNPRPGELAGHLRDPGELCQPGLTGRAGVESMLFDAFIPSAYRTPGRWDAQDAQRWLTFLARHLEHKIAAPDLAWWQLPQAVSRITLRGLSGPIGRLVAGLAHRLVVGGLAPRARHGPAHGMRVDDRSLVVGLVGGIVVGLVGGIVAGINSGLVVGLVVGLVGGIVVGLESEPSNLAAAVSPQTLLVRDRRAALLMTIVITIVIGLVGGLVVGLARVLPGIPYGLVGGLLGGLVASGLVVGGNLILIETAWPSYMLAWEWLAFHRQLPWRLMSFLDDAHQRGVLRQVGTVYQFRHIELQHRLATSPSTAPVPASPIQAPDLNLLGAQSGEDAQDATLSD